MTGPHQTFNENIYAMYESTTHETSVISSQYFILVSHISVYYQKKKLLVTSVHDALASFKVIH